MARFSFDTKLKELERTEYDHADTFCNTLTLKLQGFKQSYRTRFSVTHPCSHASNPKMAVSRESELHEYPIF